VIRFFLGLLVLVSVSFGSNGISFGHKKRVYCIQLFSLNSSHSEKKIMNKMPLDLKDEIHLHRVKKQIVGCYSQSSKYTDIKKKLKRAKRAGFKKAYIITTTRWYMPTKSEKTEQQPAKAAKKVISKYVISQIISKANRAYKNGDEMQAMMYYEMLLSAGVKSEKIKNNLCFLYGKNGAWIQAKDVIDKQRYQSKLVYAYANGAVRTLQPNFYENLKEYIMLDRSGHLALLAGYYFEQKNQMQKALAFYKRAYEKNKNDIYNSYAYARYLDIIGKKQEALALYKKLYTQTKEGSGIYKAVKLRLYR